MRARPIFMFELGPPERDSEQQCRHPCMGACPTHHLGWKSGAGRFKAVPWEERDTQLRLRERLEVNAFATAGLLEYQRMIEKGTWIVPSEQNTNKIEVQEAR